MTGTMVLNRLQPGHETRKETVVFQGMTRQKTFLKGFNGMSPSCQGALRDIYRFASDGDDADGRHVVLAMTSAARFPEIFRLVLMNIVVRLQIKHHERVENREKADRLKETLEDFHVALDAFMNPGLSLEEAARRRREKEGPRLSPPALELAGGSLVMPDEALSRDIHHFKHRARPTVERVKALNRKKSPPES